MSSNVKSVPCSSTSSVNKDGTVVRVMAPSETKITNKNPTSLSFWSKISSAMRGSSRVLMKRDDRPMRQCAAIVLIGFIAFLVEGIIAVILHDRFTMIISIVFDAALLLLLTGFTTTRWLICHNSSATPRDWMIPGPMLLLMIYDSKLSPLDAFGNDLASITEIPVLVSTNTVVTPVYRIGWESESYYHYDMKTTSIPSSNDICDVGNDYVTWCYTTVVLRLADMTRIVLSRQKAASPGDFFAQVGGYFALVQFLSWIISDIALQ